MSRKPVRQSWGKNLLPSIISHPLPTVKAATTNNLRSTNLTNLNKRNRNGMSEEVKSPNYWKSLGELARNDEYEKYVEREFPENATEMNDKVSRRSFLRVMGASIALAGFAACRRPVQKIMPYSKMPEDVVPGNPLYYASAMPFQGALSGIVVENHEGRPGKIEGNEMHPASDGNTSIF